MGFNDEPLTRRERQEKRRAEEFAPDPHRALPASEEAEMGVICSALLDCNTVIGMAIEAGVSHETFHLPHLSQLWRLIVMMWEKRKPIDIVTLTQEVADRGLLEECGGGGMISHLFTYLPTAANVEFYLETLLEKHTLRQVIRVSTEFSVRAYGEQDNVHGIIDGFEQSALSIRQFKKRNTRTVHELVMEVFNDFQASFDRAGGIAGLSTGFQDLDVQIDGLHRSEMIVIAARPSHGKTALALNIAEHMAIDCGLPVGIFSLEMSAKQLVQRLICSRAKVNYFSWRDGFRSERDYEALTKAGSEVSAARIYIDDTSGLSIQEARAKARRWKADYGIEAVFLDYLQLFSSHTKRAQENRQIEVAEISGGVKGMAKDLDVPAIVLAQLDRSVDKQARKPRLSDLRESGAIEQDADVVAALSREEMYAETEEDRRECVGLATLDILKQRSGPLGPVPLTFLKEFTRFETRFTGQQESEIDPQTTFLEPEQSAPPKGVDFKKHTRRGYQRNGD